ncbi:MAG: hypothetical protein ACI9IP_001136 [Arcticibacterium sp.]|jgi:hypothetical protein
MDFRNTQISGCLDTSFSKLCTILDPLSYPKITGNNDIITSFTDFCALGKGTCIRCNNDITFSSPTDDFNRGKAEYITPSHKSINATNKVTGDVKLT